MTKEELKAIEERCVELRKGGLIDTEMVIQLSRLIGDVGGLLDYIKDLERAHEILSDGYDQMKAHLESKIPRWIPTTERLPEKGGIYLVYEPWLYGVNALWFALGMDGLPNSTTKKAWENVSYWHPLPKGPEE